MQTRAGEEAGSTLAKPAEGRGVDAGDGRRMLEEDAAYVERFGVPITLKTSHCVGRPLGCQPFIRRSPHMMGFGHGSDGLNQVGRSRQR